MATAAAFHGLEPPALAACRILELGCGEGGQLVPLAATYPGSSCLGVDLSAAAIDRARGYATQAGVENCTFHNEDVCAFSPDAGVFDYIIAHGVYSWVPEPARQAILSICGRHLAPDGLAYISYNAYPGGHVRQMLRDLTLFHTKDIADPLAKMREARRVAEFIVEATPPNTLERHMFARVLSMYEASDALLRFDLLSEENEPVYFLDFMEGVHGHGLQFVAESGFAARELRALPPRVAAWLEGIPDRLVREQYLDFISSCGFRENILCRSGRAVEARPSVQTLRNIHLRSSLSAPTEAVLEEEGAVTFRDVFGRELSCAETVPKVLYAELGAAFPATVPYPALRSRLERRLGLGQPLDAQTERKVLQLLLQSEDTGAVECYAEPQQFSRSVGIRPCATALARVQAERGEPITVRGASGQITADPALRALLGLLDGHRDRAELAREWSRSISAARSPHPDRFERTLRLLASQGVLSG